MVVVEIGWACARTPASGCCGLSKVNAHVTGQAHDAMLFVFGLLLPSWWNVAAGTTPGRLSSGNATRAYERRPVVVVSVGWPCARTPASGHCGLSKLNAHVTGQAHDAMLFVFGLLLPSWWNVAAGTTARWLSSGNATTAYERRPVVVVSVGWACARTPASGHCGLSKQNPHVTGQAHDAMLFVFGLLLPSWWNVAAGTTPGRLSSGNATRAYERRPVVVVSVDWACARTPASGHCGLSNLNAHVTGQAHDAMLFVFGLLFSSWCNVTAGTSQGRLLRCYVTRAYELRPVVVVAVGWRLPVDTHFRPFRRVTLVRPHHRASSRRSGPLVRLAFLLESIC
ncbi:hypothetical protein V5799_003725 [Amblyomma americanum]|uniref:Uncharacterized protein n=1 Tax=Amblyomma americanum TaxID=6943 RepID=A0AAQ4D856_AMBAM